MDSLPLITMGTCQNSSLQSHPSEYPGYTDPSDQEEQHPKNHSECCMHEIEDGKQHQDSSQFFRSAYGFQRRNTDDDPCKPNDFMR